MNLHLKSNKLTAYPYSRARQNNKYINVVIGDDQEVYRSGLLTILRDVPLDNIKVIGEAINGIELIETVERLQPDVVVTNITMPEMDCIKICTHIKKNFTETGLITYSSQENLSLINELFEIGINAHLLKRTPKNEIIEAVKQASKGNIFYSSNISLGIIKGLLRPKQRFIKKKDISFTDKELSIIRLICKQYTTKEIAYELTLATRTIEDHSKRIKEKFGAINMVGIAVSAIKEGIIKLEDLN